MISEFTIPRRTSNARLPERFYSFRPNRLGIPERRIGETTDDTERTIAVVRAILQDADVRHVSVGRELLTCSKSVHPGVKSLWEFHQMATRHG